MPEGGTTPSYGDVVVARRLLTTTKLHVIIRPRGGDFLYSDLEKEIMLEDVRMARRLGVDGVVFGALTAEGDVDMEFMRQLMEEAEGMSVTFHRAFDVCRDPREALEQIIELGCDRILTSGQMPKAEEGVELLRELVERAGKRIIIMPGCGVNASNIAHIAEATGASEFHFSARSKRESDMIFRRSRVSMGGAVVIDEYSRDVTDANLVLDYRLQITDNRE
jgi:copper homeostasis protein